MEHGRRPRGLQIRLVSGNACIIGTPTPSTTRPRTSHGQVIMNKGLESKPRAPTSPRRLADARPSERKRAAQLCRSRLHAHPSRRPPPEQSSTPASRRALALNRRTLSNIQGTFAAARNAFQAVGGPKRRTRNVGSVRDASVYGALVRAFL